MGGQTSWAISAIPLGSQPNRAPAIGGTVVLKISIRGDTVGRPSVPDVSLLPPYLHVLTGEIGNLCVLTGEMRGATLMGEGYSWLRSETDL